MSEDDERAVPFSLQFVLIWAVVTIQLLWQHLRNMNGALIDTDDAMRLVEVRELLSGRGWFDMHEPRLGPPGGYDTHWSRLVDSGMAGLYHVFSPFTSHEHAEFLMRVVWPLIILGAALAGIMAVSRRLAGEPGLFASGFVAALNPSAYLQFAPGRIDHHNVQIALVVLTLAGVAWADSRRWRAIGAGISAALALAVGLECLPFIAALATALGIRYVIDPKRGAELSLFAVGFSLALLVAYIGTIAPGRLAGTACDALASNLVIPLVPAGLCLMALARAAVLRTASQRFLALAVVAAITIGVALALEPRCLSGPFAMVDPVARVEWLAKVKESLPIYTFIGGPIFAMTAIPLAVIIVIVMPLLLDPAVRRDFVFLTVLALFALATLMGVMNMKVSTYAFWFAVPLISLAATRLWQRLGILRMISRVAVVFLLAPFIYGTLALLVSAGLAENKSASESHRLCNRASDFARLSTLPAGLVISDIDTGPFILAYTEHSVLSAPYHRMGPQIARTVKLFKMPPEETGGELTELGANYVAVCRARHPQSLRTGTRDRNATLQDALLRGTPPSWLVPVLGNSGGLLLYKFAPEHVPAKPNA